VTLKTQADTEHIQRMQQTLSQRKIERIFANTTESSYQGLNTASHASATLNTTQIRLQQRPVSGHVKTGQLMGSYFLR